MKVKLCILTAVILLGAVPAFADTYSIEAFETSLPTIGGGSVVGDKADTIGQIGNEQTWYCFDITEIPDSEQIISASFTVRMRDYADNAATQRTLWYDPYDDWAFSWPHDPDLDDDEVAIKEVTELLAVISFNHDGWTWITTDVDINRHDWSKDLLDNYVTLMLTGPLNGYYSAGEAGFEGAVLELETLSATDGKDDDTSQVLNLGPEEIIQANGADIQVPGYSVPSLVDWNNDNLQDLVIGEGSGFGDAKVRVYLNVGTEAEPVFADYFYAQSEGSDLTCPASGCMGCFPRVVYWDADMRKDLLVGQADGTVKIFLNNGTDSGPVFDAGQTITVGTDKENLDVGSRATPTLIDWDNDDRMDLIVGALDGRIHIYLNCDCTDGIPPSFNYSTPSGDFATEDGWDLFVPSNRSSPVISDLDGDGKKDLLTGNTEGQLLFYKNVGTDDKPGFSAYTLVESNGAAIDLPGTPRSRPFICYWTGDGNFGPIDNYPDVLIGSGDGKVRLYRGKSETKTKAKQGDLDGNGIIDLADLALLITYWPQTDCGRCNGADLTGDGNVKKDDVHRFIDIFLLSLEQKP
ncbi:MAG: hypothetical protein ACYS6K_05055 [Planctomycetota bacterium]|jgi:hypothetical protein